MLNQVSCKIVMMTAINSNSTTKAEMEANMMKPVTRMTGTINMSIIITKV